MITNPNYRGIDPFYPPAFAIADATPEMYCPVCDSYTHDYDHNLQCESCGNDVRREV